MRLQMTHYCAVFTELRNSRTTSLNGEHRNIQQIKLLNNSLTVQTAVLQLGLTLSCRNNTTVCGAEPKASVR